MADSNFKKFLQAIKADSEGNQAIKATYKGRERKLWPLVLGRTGSVEMVLCYQYDDGSGNDPEDPSPLKNLRCFEVGQFGTTVQKIPYDGDSEGIVLDFEQVKKQTCVVDVKIYRLPEDP